MAEQIGLEATFDLSGWSANQKKYVSGLDQASSATDKAAGGMGKAWNQLGSSVTKTTAILGGAVVGAAALAGAAIAKFTGDGISKAIELDQKMADIAATLNMTKDQVAPLNDLILQLGIDPMLKVSATEAAGAIEILAKNGLTMTEIMGGAAKATVLLSNATGADFNTSADIATSAMEIFNISANDMIDAVNGITSVTVVSKFDMNDYALALAQGGAVAKAVGVEFNDFNTIIAGISPLFASGSDAGTSVKTMLTRLIPASSEAEDAMADLGLITMNYERAAATLSERLGTDVLPTAESVQDAWFKMAKQQGILTDSAEKNAKAFADWQGQFDQNMFYDVNGQLKDMNDISVLLYESTKDLTEEEKNKALATIFGSDASRAAIGIAALGKTVYTDLSLAVKETGLSQEILTGYMKDGELTAYELLQAQQGLTDANAQAATRMDTVAGAMEIFRGVVETLQIQIGQAFLPIIRQMVEVFTAFVTQNSPAIIAAFQAFATNIASVIAYVAAAITTGTLFNEKLGEMAPALQTVVVAVTGMAGAVATIVGPVIDLVAQFVSWNDVLIVLGAAISTVVLPAIYGLIAAMAPVIGTFALAVGAVAAVRLAWESDFLGIQTTVTNAINAIIGAFAPLTAAIAEFGTGALAEIKAFATGNATEFENLKAIWEGAKESVNNLFTSIVGFVQAGLPTWTASLREWGTAAWQWIIDAHAQALAAIAQFIAAIISFVSSRLPTWIATFTQWTTAAWQWIVDAIAEVGPKIAQWFTALVGAVSSRLPAWKTAFIGWTTAMGAWIAESVANLAGNINQWFSSLSGGVSSKLPSFKSSMLKFATALVEWISSSAADALPKLGAWLGKIVAWIPLAALGLAKALVQMASALVGWIAGGEGSSGETAVSKADPAMAEFQKVLIDALKAVGVAFVAAGQAFVTEFATTLTGGADWNQVGQEILNAVRTGFESVRDAVYNSVTLLVQRVVDFFLDTDWEQLGADIMDAVRAGVESMTSAIVQAVKDIVEDMKQKFRESISAFTSLGKDIIAGVLSGLKANGQAVIDYITGLITDALGSVTSLLGIESPSKVFAEIGKNMIQGLIVGMESMRRHLLATSRNLTSSLVGNVKDGVKGLASAINSVTSLAGAFYNDVKEMVDENTGDPLFAALLGNYDDHKRTFDILKKQADLIAFMQASGGDITMLSGLLGSKADPTKLLAILTQTTADLNIQLEKEMANTIRIAALNYDDLVDSLRGQRKTAAEIEAEFSEERLSVLEQFRADLLRLEKEIAETEAALLATGSADQKQKLLALQAEHKTTADQMREHLRQMQIYTGQMEELAKFKESIQDVLTDQRLSDEFKSTFETMFAAFEDVDTGAIGRTKILQELERFVFDVRENLRQIGEMTDFKASIQDLLGDATVGANFKRNVEAVFGAFDNPKRTVADRDKMLKDLKRYTDNVRVLQRIGQVEQADAPALRQYKAELSGILDRLLDMNLAERDRIQLTKQYTASVQKLAGIQEQTNQLTDLQEQRNFLEEIKALAAESGDGGMLRRIFAGQNALTPESLATIYGRFIDESVLAAQDALAATMDDIRAAVTVAEKGYDKLVTHLRAYRGSLSDIEENNRQLSGIELLRKQIEDLDGQIATVEERLLSTGQAHYAAQLRTLHDLRMLRTNEFSQYLQMWQRVESAAERAADFAGNLTNDQAANAVQRFIERQITPLVELFQSGGATSAQRAQWTKEIERRVVVLNDYKTALFGLNRLQERLNFVTSDSNFGATIAKNVQPLLDVLYDPALSGPERNRLFNVLSGYQTKIAGLLSTFNRVGSHSVFGNLGDLLTPYLNRLLDVNLAEADRNKITAEYNRINQRLQSAQALDQATVSLNERLDLLNKIKALSAEMGSDSVLKYIIGDVDLMKGLSPEQFAGVYQRYSEQAVAAASRALREALMPDLTKQFNAIVGRARSFQQIMAEFDQAPTTDLERAEQYLAQYDAEIERLRVLATKGNQQALEQAKLTMGHRDQTIAWIRQYMDALVKADKHVARIQETTDERAADIAATFKENLIDPLRALMEKNIGADYRAILVTQIGQRVDQLNSYVRQVGALSTLQKDLSDALGFNPLVARFAEMRLDPLLEQIYNINTAEAERLRLVQLYRQEQEKIVALNQKVQQLEFLEMQLSLLEQITQLNEEFGEQVPLEDILSGIQFGVNANMDQMIQFVSESLDAILRVTKEKLGIASPSKVFAKIGAQMMQGMTMGIQSSIMQPIGMLRSAISDIPYAMQGRSLAVNMGGVTINNGMDDVMFEARVRQIVQREFN